MATQVVQSAIFSAESDQRPGGLPLNLHHADFNPKGGYLAFLGRISLAGKSWRSCSVVTARAHKLVQHDHVMGNGVVSFGMLPPRARSPEKDPVQAIRIAQAVNMELRIAAKVDRADEQYFREQVKPLLDLPGIEFIGELGEKSPFHSLKLFKIAHSDKRRDTYLKERIGHRPVVSRSGRSKPSNQYEDTNMRQNIVATVSAAALAAFTFAAYAHAADDGPQGGAPPSASQQSGPAGAAGPGEMSESRNGQSGAESRRPDGAQTGERSSRQENSTERNKSAETGDKARMDRDRKSADTGDRKQMDRDRKAEADDRDRMDRDRKTETGDNDHMDRDRKSAETGDRKQMDRDRKAEAGDRDRMDRDGKTETGDKAQMDRDRKSADTGDRDRDHKTGDRTAVRIDSDQKQKVRTYFSQHRPSSNRIDRGRVSVSIGLPLPVGIALAPLPPDIIVVAADCPLQYFVWGDDVVLVDSCSREVVDIIPNIG